MKSQTALILSPFHPIKNDLKLDRHLWLHSHVSLVRGPLLPITHLYGVPPWQPWKYGMSPWQPRKCAVDPLLALWSIFCLLFPHTAKVGLWFFVIFPEDNQEEEETLEWIAETGAQSVWQSWPFLGVFSLIFIVVIYFHLKAIFLLHELWLCADFLWRLLIWSVLSCEDFYTTQPSHFWLLSLGKPSTPQIMYFSIVSFNSRTL